MPTRIVIASPEGHAGKSIVALGLVDALSRRVGRVGVFRPVARSVDERDRVLELLLAAGVLWTDACPLPAPPAPEPAAAHGEPDQQATTESSSAPTQSTRQ